MKSLLSRPRILEELHNGNLVIDLFVPRNLGTSSYDVTLGEWFYREQRPTPDIFHPRPIYNPFDEHEVNRVWGRAQQAQPASLVVGKRLERIPESQPVILLKPGETILAHTREFIGGACDRITTMMKARSSLGRNFIEVCKCAGWGDIPYFNRWTMEITNNSQYYAIPLVVGRRIGQITFFETDPLSSDEMNYTTEGKYQVTTDLQDLKTRWSPEMMLPKQYRDWDAQPLPCSTR